MGDFFPDSLSGWLGLLLAAASIVTSAFALIRQVLVKPLSDHLEAHKVVQGERLGKAEQAMTANSSKIEALDRQMDRLHIQVAGISEQFGRMETRLQGLDTTLYRFHEERMAEDRRAGERLVAIETRMSSILERLPLRV